MSDNSSSQRLIGLQGGAEVFHRYRFTANKTNTTRTVLVFFFLSHRYHFTANKTNTTRAIAFTYIALLQTRQTRLVPVGLSQISLYYKQDQNDSYRSFTDIALMQTRQKRLVQFFPKYRFTAKFSKPTCSEKLSPCKSSTNVFLFLFKIDKNSNCP